MNAYELRHGDKSRAVQLSKNTPKTGIYIICDNILDVTNLGGIFRIADSLGANEVLLTGDCKLPHEDKRIQKSSVNCTNLVNWSYSVSAAQAIENLRGMVSEIIALELTDKATDFDRRFYPNASVAIVIGNEQRGISAEALALCDSQVKLPMYGVNSAMNVGVSLAVFGHHLLVNRTPYHNAKI